MRSAAARLGGLVSLVVLLVVVLGVPVGLFLMAGWPLPRSVPVWDEVRQALSSNEIPDGFYLDVLAVVGWLVWAYVLVSAVIEGVARARGVAAPTVPLGGWIQGPVRRLVASAALVFSVVGPRAAMASPLPPLPPPAAVASATPAATLTVDRAPVEGPTCVVGPREDLWHIAERHLGDPGRWREVFNLNAGRAQADGGVLREVDDALHEGWTLRLPADGVVRADRAGPEATPPPSASGTPTSPPAGPAVGLRPSPGRIAAELAEQAFESDPAVRAEVAAHPLTPAAVLTYLTCNDTDPMVRSALASNSSLPSGCVEIFGTSADEGERLSASIHPAASPALLRFLAADAVHEVSLAAGERVSSGLARAPGR